MPLPRYSWKPHRQPVKGCATETTADDILRTASGEIGYARWADPDHGTKYGRWYAGLTKSPYFGQNGVPFCAMGVSWVFDQCGQKCPGLPSAAITSASLGSGRSADMSDRTADAPSMASVISGMVIVGSKNPRFHACNVTNGNI